MRSRHMPRATGASVAVERACDPNPDRGDPGLHRAASRIRWGDIFAVLVAAVATAMFYEWTRMVRGWGLGWHVGGFLYALLPALALLWIRERDAHGLTLLIWAFIVTWSTDIGAFLSRRKKAER
jgi:CDP-diglyceride synthetase